MVTKKKHRISDEKFRDILFAECNKGTDDAHLKTNFYELLSTKYSVHKARALQLHDIYYPEWAKLNQKGINEGTVTNGEAQAKKGLKSRTDRIMQLQNEIEHMESQLRGDVEFTFIVGNSIKTSHTSGVFILPVQVQNEIRREIRAHNSEISRLEGDYAATKSDLTTNGKSLNTSFQIEVIDRRENVENE